VRVRILLAVEDPLEEEIRQVRRRRHVVARDVKGKTSNTT
jgi:hypothetical protein